MAEEKQSRSAGRTQQGLATVPMGGKTLPNAVTLEGPLLGALMLSDDLAKELNDFLLPQHFYAPRHQQIYEAIQHVLRANLPVDLHTVIQQLSDQEKLAGVGGVQYVAELTALVASTAHAGEHAQIVVQKALQRQLISVLAQVQEDAYDGMADVYDLIEQAEAGIFDLHNFGRRKESRPIEEVIDETLDEVRKAGERNDGLSGLSTGFDNLDEITQGLQKGNFIVIGGRPSMGKTAFVLTMARNMAVKYGTGVAFFSLEMADTELALRLMIAESGLGGKMVKAGKLDVTSWQRMNQACEVLSKMKFFLDDTQQLTVSELRAKARRLKARHDIGLIIVDYLQLMEPPKEDKSRIREQDVSNISRSLKGLAKELELPVVALAQLSRQVDTREKKRPQLSDMRESGAIEQDADIVAVVHRPEFYHIGEYPDGTSTSGMAELVVLKNRHGSVGTLYFRFIPDFAQFQDVGDRIDHYMKSDAGKVAVQPAYEARMSANVPSGDVANYHLNMPSVGSAVDMFGPSDDTGFDDY